MHDIRQFYTERINILSEEITLLKGNSKKMTIWLLLSFSAIVLFIIAYFAWNGGILSLVLAGCERHTPVWKQMDIAESLMNTKPDSSLAVLNGIPTSDIKGKETSARCAKALQ